LIKTKNKKQNQHNRGKSTLSQDLLKSNGTHSSVTVEDDEHGDVDAAASGGRMGGLVDGWMGMGGCGMLAGH